MASIKADCVNLRSGLKRLSAAWFMKKTAPWMSLSPFCSTHLSRSSLLQSGTAESDPWHGRVMPVTHESAGSMLTVFGLPLRLKTFLLLKCWANCFLKSPNAVAAIWKQQDMDTVFFSSSAKPSSFLIWNSALLTKVDWYFNLCFRSEANRASELINKSGVVSFFLLETH